MRSDQPCGPSSPSGYGPGGPSPLGIPLQGSGTSAALAVTLLGDVASSPGHSAGIMHKVTEVTRPARGRAGTPAQDFSALSTTPSPGRPDTQGQRSCRPACLQQRGLSKPQAKARSDEVLARWAQESGGQALSHPCWSGLGNS